MGKKSKKIKIPKNRDIEEFVEQHESCESIEDIQQTIEVIDNKAQKFKKDLEVSIETEEVNDKAIEKRVRNFINRRKAQIADNERRIKYLKAMNEVEER